MTPHKQLFRHRPDEGVFGDCQRTAIACLLDLDPSQVPHHHRHLPDGEQRRLLDEWLAPRGLKVVFMAFRCEPAEMLAVMKVANPGLFYMLSGTSRTGVNHVVIAQDDRVVHDPSLDDSGIIGPCDDGCTYIEFLVPTFLVAQAA